LLRSLVAPAVPEIQRNLHTSVNGVSWVLTAYLLSASIATPVIGRLGDMYGKARLLVVVLALLCVATVVSALATVWGWLSAKTVVVFAVGVVLLIVWVRTESRSPNPLVDMRMMRIRGVWTTNSVAALLGFGMYASFILLPEYVETPTRAG
jgi:MFS family permease